MLRCINCHLCVDRMQRHVISTLLPSIQTLLATWRSLQQFPPKAVICQECYVILNNHCLNGNMNAERELGHLYVCLGCGRSVLGTPRNVQHQILEADHPLIDTILSWNVDCEVLSSYSHVCHQCWMRACRQQSKESLEHCKMLVLQQTPPVPPALPGPYSQRHISIGLDVATINLPQYKWAI